MDRILEAPEPIQLRHRVDSTRRKVFLVGEHVPDEWLLPGEGGTPVPAAEVADDAGPGSVDWDAEDAGLVEVAAAEAVVTEVSVPTAEVDLSGSVAAVEAQILALPEAERAEAAERAIKQENLSRAPRQSLLTAMRKITQGS